MRLIPLALAAVLAAVSTASTLEPPVVPLVVRNPYLSAWLPNAREVPWARWPIFWNGDHVGLALMAHIPSQGAVYPLLGRPQDSLQKKDSRYESQSSVLYPSIQLLTSYSYHIKYPSYLGTTYDASTTNLTYSIDAGSSYPLNLTISFLSPITPTSTLRQSIPAAYVTIDVQGDVDVNIYMDVTGQWLSKDARNNINWERGTLKTDSQQAHLQRWQVRRETEELLSENDDHAEWGTLNFAGPTVCSHPQNKRFNFFADQRTRMRGISPDQTLMCVVPSPAPVLLTTPTTTSSAPSTTVGLSLRSPNRST